MGGEFLLPDSVLSVYFSSLCRLPEGERLEEFYRHPVDPDWLGETEAAQFAKLSAHAVSTGRLDETTVREVFGQLPEGPPTTAHCRERLYHRHMVETLKDAIGEANKLIQDKKEPEALDHIRQKLMPLGRLGDDTSYDYAEKGLEKFRQHLLRKKHEGSDHFDFGWRWFDDNPHGVGGGDVVTVAGRPGAGKSSLLLYMASANWDKGRSVLFYSMETNVGQVQSRLAGLHARISPSLIDTGKLSDNPPSGAGQVQAIEKVLEDHKGRRPFWLVDGTLSASMADLVGHCALLRPDVLFVDAAYLLKVEARGYRKKHEVIEEVLVGIKRDISLKLSIPVVVSFQLNREAAKDSNIGLEGLADADAIGRLSSVVIYVGSDKDSAYDIQRQIRVVKNRNGPPGVFAIRFCYGGDYCMDFSQMDGDEAQNLDISGPA